MNNKPYKCFSGPYHGQTLYLSTGGTLAFRLGNMKGRYVASVTSPKHTVWIDESK